MLVTSEDEMAEAMSFAGLTDAVAVAMEQCSAQHHAFIAETDFKKTTLVKTQRYFANISILLVTENFFAQYCTAMGRKLQKKCFCTKRNHQAVCVQCDRHRILKL
jgi:hypothetical protein